HHVIIPGPSPCPAPTGTNHAPLTISHPTGSQTRAVDARKNRPGDVLNDTAAATRAKTFLG
ncbi:hypothetical protein, partial [Streptomyces sp. NPDC051286]|uniref:hypothetical protein n=1 Tax=Streptomyces sp. NPDC051286 TaxID=3365647 RepID=UPI0037B636EC